MDPVGTQGIATFAWVWRGAVDSDAGGCCGIANEPSPDTVAMMWDSPTVPSDTRISFLEPVEAVYFHYTLDTGYGTPTAVFYDQAGVEVGNVLLNVCGAIGCGSSCAGDPTGSLCSFEQVRFAAGAFRGISYIEFEDAGSVFGNFAIDDLVYFDIDPIFLDGFETGNTAMWYTTVGLPPPCSDIEVGPLAWLGTDRVRIEAVRNANPDYAVLHTRTVLDWTKVHPTQYFNYMRFDEIGDIRTEDDDIPPTEQSIDIPFSPGQESRFTAGWAGWDHTTNPLSGDIQVTFDFTFPDFGNTCAISRSISQPTPIPTITPTFTATSTFTPTLTPTHTPTSTPTPLAPANCADFYFAGPLAPYSWYMRGPMRNDSSLYSAEIIRTRYEWYQPDPATYVDVYWSNDTADNYWSVNNGNPRCYAQPACEFFRGDVAWNAANAVVPPSSTRYWGVDVDGPMSDQWYGDYQVCLDIEFNDQANTVCANICSSYSGGGTPTPTHTATHTFTPIDVAAGGTRYTPTPARPSLK